MRTTRHHWTDAQLQTAREQIDAGLHELPEWLRHAIVLDYVAGRMMSANFTVIADRIEWLYERLGGFTAENDPVVLGVETALTIAQRAAAGPEEDE